MQTGNKGENRGSITNRRNRLESELGVTLKHISDYSIDPKRATLKNIENMIGAVQIPLGIAGPVKINGKYAQGNFYIPLATTEGALVASVNRGCRAINESGGAKVRILQNVMSRSILFKTKSISDSNKLVDWIDENKEFIKKRAEGTSHHLNISSLKTWVIGRRVWLRLAGDTGDAMGMNMLTIASDAVGREIEKSVDNVKYVATSGNACVDKKSSAMNNIMGRGKWVVAETRLSRDTLKKTLKTNIDNMLEISYGKLMLGSALSGSYGFNAHFANMVAAMFIATGQDPAQVVEGSQGFTTFEREDKKLYVSITLPALQVGTVGGGTTLETQSEVLSMLGINGGGSPPGTNSNKLAEIIGVSVLAGEISLTAALSSKDLAKSHNTLGRGNIKKTK